MTRKFIALVGVCAISLFVPSCGYDQRLESISVSPDNTTITGAGLLLQFTAIGHYSHPFQDKDITTQVVWASDADQIITFCSSGSTYTIFCNGSTKPGLAVSGCGTGTNIGVLATVYKRPNDPSSGRVVQGTATVNVSHPSGGDPRC